MDIENLPRDVYNAIFPYLRPVEVGRLARTSRNMRAIVDDYFDSKLTDRMASQLPALPVQMPNRYYVYPEYLTDAELYYELKIRGRRDVPTSRVKKVRLLTDIFEGRMVFERRRQRRFSLKYERTQISAARTALQDLSQNLDWCMTEETRHEGMCRAMYICDRTERVRDLFALSRSRVVRDLAQRWCRKAVALHTKMYTQKGLAAFFWDREPKETWPIACPDHGGCSDDKHAHPS